MTDQNHQLSRLAVSLVDALYLLGWCGTRQEVSKAASNLISRNRFPVPIRTIGKHRRVLMADLVKVTGSEVSPQPAEPKIVKDAVVRGRGRPRKGVPS
jgi:hypothetical protein